MGSNVICMTRWVRTNMVERNVRRCSGDWYGMDHAWKTVQTYDIKAVYDSVWARSCERTVSHKWGVTIHLVWKSIDKSVWERSVLFMSVGTTMCGSYVISDSIDNIRCRVWHFGVINYFSEKKRFIEFLSSFGMNMLRFGTSSCCGEGFTLILRVGQATNRTIRLDSYSWEKESVFKGIIPFPADPKDERCCKSCVHIKDGVFQN